MKLFNKIVLAVFIVSFLFVVIRPFLNMDEEAILLMTGEERDLVEMVENKIDKNSTKEEVLKILGEPTEYNYLVLKWNGLGSSILNQGRIYFSFEEKAQKFRLMKLGYYFYEIDLR